MATRDTTTEGNQDEQRHVGFGASRAGEPLGAQERPARRGVHDRTARLLAAGLAVLIVAWAVVNLAFEGARFAMLAPEVMREVAAASTIAKLLAALVLLLLSADEERRRLRWVAGGVVVLAVGQVVLTYLEPLLRGSPNPDAQLYGRLVVYTIVGVLFVVGLLPNAAPRFSRRSALIVSAVFGALMVAVTSTTSLLPPLIEATGDEFREAAQTGVMPPGLTGWHWSLSALPVLLAVLAALWAARRGHEGTLAGWVVVASVLLAGSQLHNIFWPSSLVSGGYVLTTAQLLLFALAMTIVVGGIIELKRIAAERSALLAVEQEQARRLRELALLKADFTAMVAHELSTPLATIQGYADMLSTGKVPPERREQALAAIRTETDVLHGLVADVQTAASTEREDFAVRARPMKLEDLLEEAKSFAEALDGDHPLSIKAEVHGWVRADAERIGQVLRNLLSNAVKYSEPGSPIELRAEPVAGADGSVRVRIEVEDKGPGIHSDDLSRIFEKFGRGRDQENGKIAGSGLGLYLSRRIVRAHGSELTVSSTLGEGSVFAFELEAVR